MEFIELSNSNVKETAARAASALSEGGIVLYPTDTIYGLGVDATNHAALVRLKELKGRDKKKPISVIMPDLATIERYAVLGGAARKLAEKFLPGALTLVLPVRDAAFSEITLNNAIGIRIPDDEFCRALSQAFGKPFTSTSANRAGRETARHTNEVLAQFGDRMSEVALVVDGGERKNELPSTVVSCIGETPHVLREGALSREALGL